jgi:DNA excision repair protein ERCC-2
VLSRRALSEIRAALPAKDGAGEARDAIFAAAAYLCEDMILAIEAAGRDVHGDAGRITPDRELFLRLDGEARILFAQYVRSDLAFVKDDPVLRLLRLWDDFGAAVTSTGEAFVAIYERGGGDEVIRIVCLDASAALAETFKDFAKVVAFSATLTPFPYYARLSGFDPEKATTLEVPSPFPGANRKVLVIPQVSTKLRARARHVARIADAVERITAVRPGNYAVFFPSFRFLEDTARHFKAVDAGGPMVLTQRPQATRAEIKAIVDALEARATAGEPTLLLAVQGGGLSEGLDFPGDLLVGAVIVGPAIPTVGPAREAMRAYFDKHYGQGDAYAYTVPAMTRVVQAAGRVIRSEKDRGLIVLMDERFIEARFASLMPKGWYKDSVKELVSTKILDDVRTFWQAGAPDAHGGAVDAPR